MNRRQRRQFRLGMKPSHLPIDLGINQYKREHKGESKRIKYFKEELWKAYHELKSKP